MFFKLEDGQIKKFEIVFDRKRIEDIRTEVINNCSEIRYKEIESFFEPSSKDSYSEIRNCIKGKYLEIHGQVDGEDEYLYEYSYDEYYYPYLVWIIDELLKGNYWDGMFEYSENMEKTAYEKFDYSSKKMIEENKQDDPDVLKKLKELALLLAMNKNQQSTKWYYKLLNDEVKLEFIDSINIDKVEEVEKFFNIDLKRDKVKNKIM